MAVIYQENIFGSQTAVTPNTITSPVAKPGATLAPQSPKPPTHANIDWAAVRSALSTAGLSKVLTTQQACGLSIDAINQKVPGYRPNSLSINHGDNIWKACHPQAAPKAMPLELLGTMPQPSITPPGNSNPNVMDNNNAYRPNGDNSVVIQQR